MTMTIATPVTVADEHMNMVAEGMRRMFTHADYYRFTNKIQPKLIVYGSGNQWHVATHDGTCVSRIWSTHNSKESASAAYNIAVGAIQLRKVMESAAGRIHIRFDIELEDNYPMWRPVAWRPVDGDAWQRFDNAPWIPQADVYATVQVVGGELERECHGANREMVYWYQK